VLTCGQGSDQGNFGTLDLPPANPPASGLHGVNDQISYNIIKGLTSTLSAFDPTKFTTDFQCTPTSDGSTVWDGAGTNCVRTQPGVPQNAAEQGFLFGIPSTTYNQGLLQDVNPANFCPNAFPPSTPHTATTRSVTVNNDVLSCFFTNDNLTKVSQVSSKTYTGPVVIDQSIYKSPRFVTVPVLKFPGTGSCCRWQILEFRPAFITDQPANATRATGAPIMTPGCAGSANNFTGECNGLKFDHGQLLAVNVVFINPSALPDPPLDANGKYIPYTGTGSKVAILIN
jgi:hypothetical protein